jgi:cell division protein FtsQ
MARSLAARAARPFSSPSNYPPRARGGSAAQSLLRLGLLWSVARYVLRLGRHRRLRNVLLIAMATVLALGGGWLWLRDSSLVAVERVQVRGVHGANAREIDAALTQAAKRMSTLHVHLGVLRAAVAAYPEVRAVQVKTSFPHAMHITVIEQLPVAAITVGNSRIAVAADGVVLGDSLASKTLPSIQATTLFSKHVTDSQILQYLTVLGDAPASLARRIQRVYTNQAGLTVAMRNGLLLYFGDATRPHAKWLSVASVLADPSAVGASYVDVRLPERPAAGGSGATASSVQTGQTSASESSSGALAASLASAVKGEAPSETPSASSTPSTTTPAGASAPGSSSTNSASNTVAGETSGSASSGSASTALAPSTVSSSTSAESPATGG